MYGWYVVCICVHIYTLYRRKHACVCGVRIIWYPMGRRACEQVGRVSPAPSYFAIDLITREGEGRGGRTKETRGSLIRSHAYTSAPSRALHITYNSAAPVLRARTCVFDMMVYLPYTYTAPEKEGRRGAGGKEEKKRNVVRATETDCVLVSK